MRGAGWDGDEDVGHGRRMEMGMGGEAQDGDRARNRELDGEGGRRMEAGMGMQDARCGARDGEWDGDDDTGRAAQDGEWDGDTDADAGREMGTGTGNGTGMGNGTGTGTRNAKRANKG